MFPLLLGTLFSSTGAFEEVPNELTMFAFTFSFSPLSLFHHSKRIDRKFHVTAEEVFASWQIRIAQSELFPLLNV